MIGHVVTFRWVEGATAEQVQAVADALRALPARIPEIRSYRCGPDLGLHEGNGDFVVVAEFDSAEDQATYRDHPDHVAVIQNELAAIMAERVAVQYAID